MEVFDIFISYSHENTDSAEKVQTYLEDEGWTVWIDAKIPVGSRWSTQLEKALDTAKGIVVLWTRHACQSDWVKKEADYALAQGKLFGVKLDYCSVPDRFSQLEMAELEGWEGEMDHPEWVNFLRSLAERAVPSRKEQIRPGFDSRFLGEDRRIPWPSVHGAARQIHYLHFSVVANPARRLAWYVAYNVDMRQAGDLGKRPMRLAEDSLISREFQPKDQHFRASGFDRGHLACRKSIGWGEDKISEIAGRQAFYITNTAPQHPAVNRGSYLAVERWEQRLSESCGRLIVFCGPALKEGDITFRDEEIGDDGFIAYATFRIPQAYWKIILALDEHRHVVRRSFYFPNPDPKTKNVSFSKDIASYDVSFENLCEQLSYITFPDEMINAKSIPLTRP